MADPTAALEHRLRLAHQGRRAKEHQLDDVRRALCDVGLMQDDDPFGHADLADVIRRLDVDVADPPKSPPLLTRKAIRGVLLFVSGCVYSMHRDYVEDLTDRLCDLYGVEAATEERAPESTLAPCAIDHDCPGQPRPEPLTGSGERRCQSQYRPEGEALVQCGRELHLGDGVHTDFDPDEPLDASAGPANITRRVWRDEDEAAHRG